MTYRIMFTVGADTVYVISIRHTARDDLEP
jgi:hypothetical protein